MKLTTLLEIVAELKRNTDIKTIAEKYKISERTLYRYKKELATDKSDTTATTDKNDTDNNDTETIPPVKNKRIIKRDNGHGGVYIQENKSTDKSDTDKNDTVIITNSMNLHNIKKRIIRR